MVAVGVVLVLVGAALLVAEAHLPAGVLGIGGGLALAVWGRQTVSGREALSGHTGVVRRWNGTDGQVLVDGALWRACCSWPDGGETIGEGDSVVVERVKGLTLAVRKAEDWETT